MQKGSENMNRIFKVIWSKTRNCYVVASELAKGTSKSTSTGRMAKRAVLAAVAALLISPLGAGYSYATIDSATINGTQVITGTQKDAKNLASTVMKATNNANDIGNLKTAMQSVENELAQHQMLIDNLDTDKLTLSSDNTLQKETYDSATKTTTTTDVTGLKVAGPVSAKSASISGTLSAGGAVNAGSVNSRGNITAVGTIAGQTVTATGTMKGKDLIGSNSIISQGTIAATGNISSQATVGAKEMVSQTNITAKNKVVGMQGVVDNTLTSGNYVTAGNTVGKNIVTLDTQVKANADAIAEKANAIHDEIKAGDEKLDTRITNVKEYLEKQTSDTYVSKDDAAVQDGAIVKADKTIGENVTNLDAALAKETADRLGADKAPDKVIETVNQNMVDGFNTINKNMADGFTALNQADANEAAAREAADTTLQTNIDNEAAARKAADTKLVEAVNSGLSLSNDNVLQKNTTSVGEDGTVTTSKEAATTLVMNKGGDNQITLSDKGIKVGLNSTVQDAKGFYAGGDTAAAAKAALNADGSIKGANGAFAVDTSGNVTSGNVTSTGTVTGKSLTDGTASLSGGNLTGAHNVTADGTITGATLTDGKATISNGNIKTNGGFIQTDGGNVNTQGGEVRTNGGKVATSGGEINTGSGAIKTVGGDILTAGGKLNTSGGDIAAGTGNISGQNITASGVLSGDSLTVAKGMTGHSLTLTGGDLDAGAGTIKTTGKVQAGTLETTGDATIGGDLDVKGDLSVEGKFNANTLSSKLDENNYTEIHGGNVTSVNSKVDTTDGKIYTSTATLTEKGKTETASNGINRNVEKMDATESSNVISNDANGQNSTFKQRVDEILNQINSSDTVFSKVDQKVDNITSEVTDGTNTTSSAQTTTDITNTAKQGTITNEAQKLVNKASDTISNEAANNITNTSTNGNIANTATNGTISNNAKELTNTASDSITNTAENGNISNIASNGTISNEAKTISNKAAEAMTNDAKTITNTASESVTTQIGDGSTVQSVMNESGIANKATGKSITNDAATITNTGTTSVTNQVGNNKVLVDTTHVQSAFGDTIYTTWDESGITNNATDKTVTTNAKDILNTATGDITNSATNGNMTNNVGKDLTTTVGGKQTTTVTGDSSLTAENINNTAKNKITNKAIDVETDASSSIVNKVSNDAGSNTSTQLSYETKEEMSQADGKTASYLHGAAEEKSQLIDGSKKTTIDTIAGQTNTNITDGTNTSNSLQKADQVASSVTDGTNTTVVNQDAKSLASSITDGTKANNTNNTVDKSEQLIKASDTQYSATTKTATKTEDALISGSNIIDVIKGLDAAGNPLISSAVTDGTTITGISQNAKDINLSAAGGTITNDAQNITNKAAETLSNSAQNITNTASEKITNQIGDGSAVKSEMTADGITNTAEGGTIYNKSKDILNEASGDILNFADGEIGNVATKITNITGDTTVTSDTNGTTFENKAHNTAIKEGTVTKTTISGNTIETGQAKMDYAEVMKDLGVHGNATVDQKLTVKGDSDLQGNANVGKNLTVNGTSDLKGNVTMESNATVQKDLTVNGTTTTNKLVVNNGATIKGGTTTDTLHVTSSSTFDGAATFKDVVTMEKDLSVGGNATVAGSMTASSYKVGDKTYISESGINANNQKVVNVAAGDLSANSTDAVNGAQLYQTNERVTGVENKVNKLDSRVDKVGANAAALANLHPLEFDADSKWNIAAAVGGYKGETATAIGAFYRPNENVMVNVSSSFGTGENMYGGGISLRIGQGGNKARRNATNGLTEREKAMQKQIDSLTSRLDALLSVINPNMSKDFPDVPENHWAYEAVSRLAGNGVIQGYEDGKYHGDRTMTRYEMAEIIYNALSKGAKAEKKLVEEFKPELQAMAAQKKA